MSRALRQLTKEQFLVKIGYGVYVKTRISQYRRNFSFYVDYPKLYIEELIQMFKQSGMSARAFALIVQQQNRLSELENKVCEQN